MLYIKWRGLSNGIRDDAGIPELKCHHWNMKQYSCTDVCGYVILCDFQRALHQAPPARLSPRGQTWAPWGWESPQQLQGTPHQKWQFTQTPRTLGCTRIVLRYILVHVCPEGFSLVQNTQVFWYVSSSHRGCMFVVIQPFFIYYSGVF